MMIIINILIVSIARLGKATAVSWHLFNRVSVALLHISGSRSFVDENYVSYQQHLDERAECLLLEIPFFLLY